ncbi:MAG: Bax inhibitor-1/YccA family protein [Lachnospiraceae bacterium]|nr:Bax inhibitor-1/YccA family protein [Lachnospiraceae bacterium]
MNETYNTDPRSGQTYSGFEAAPSLTLNDYIGRTFLWMAAGLALTFAVAFGMAAGHMVERLYSGVGSVLLIVAAVAQIAVVVVMGVRLQKMSVAGARICFFLYAALTGVTFSIYFVVYDLDVLIYAFAATALFFGGMAVVTLVFHLDVSRIAPLLFGGLILLLITGAIGMIFHVEVLLILECWLGIAIFVGYTAYDTQMIVRNYQMYAGNDALLQKASIYSALQLYLDFINLLIRIIRIFGNSSSKD